MTDPINNQLTKSQYAEYKGVSRAMVSKWARDGRLVLTDDGKFVLVAESDARIKLTASLNGTFYDQKAKEEREIINKNIAEKGLTELSQEVNYQQLDLEVEDAEVLFRNAKAMKEKAMALQLAAEHEKFMGNLIEREHVNRIFFERFRQFRDGLASLNRRLAPELAAIDNIEEISRILERDHRNILDNFEKLPIIE